MTNIHRSMLIVAFVCLITILGIILGLVSNYTVAGYAVGSSIALLGFLDIMLVFHLRSRGDPILKNPDYILRHAVIILVYGLISFLLIFSNKGYWLQCFAPRD